MTRRPLGALLLCLLGCGAAPAPAPSLEAAEALPPAWGWLPTPAADATLWPREAEAADTLLRRTLPDLLRPATHLAEAWARAGQQFSDVVSEPAVPGEAGRTFWGRWGLAPGRPLRFVLTAVDGPRAGRALMRVLGAFQGDAGSLPAAQAAVDEALSSAPVADVQARVFAEVVAPERLTEALRFHLERRGYLIFEVGEPPPPFVTGVALPRDAILLARDPQTGDAMLLRGRGDSRAIDWISAVSPRVLLATLVRLAVAEDATPPPTPADSRLTFHLPGLALLELARATASAFRALEAPTQTPGAREEMLVAATDLAAACSDRWRRLGRVGFSAGLRWQAGEALTLAVDATGHGRAAVNAARGPQLLDAKVWAGMPLSAYARWRRAAFLQAAPELGDLPPSPWLLWEEALICSAGHPLTALAAVAVALPAMDIASWVPAPVPGDLALLGERPWFMAAAVLGGAPRTAELGPRIGLASVADAADHPARTEPLGSAARVEVTPDGPRFSVGAGAGTLAYARRELGDGREAALLGFGEGALEAVESAVAWPGPDDAPDMIVALDAAGLLGAGGFSDDAELRGVLEVWAAERLGLALTARLTDAHLLYTLSVRRGLEPPPSAR